MQPLKSLTKVRRLSHRIVNGLGLKQSESKLRGDSFRFWVAHPAHSFGVNSHWRGHGVFENDDERWLSLGQRHLAKFERLSAAASSARNVDRVLEWGCGGGSNAVAFGRIANQFIAVDISPKSVDECLHQMSLHGLPPASGIVADIDNPEEAVRSLELVDVVLCTYVFELLPTREYALRLLKLFLDRLKPGGLAFIQIRYATTKRSTHGRAWGYQHGFSKMVAFPIDEFWQAASHIGFQPACIDLLPVDETVQDERYAYFLLEKPSVNS